MKKIYSHIAIFFFLLSFLLPSCGNPLDFNRPGDKLTGYVTHINMNLISGGYYSISVYSADSTNPFNRIPVRTDSLNLTRRDNLYETFYDMSGVSNGNYYIAATWSRYPRVPNEIPIVLGKYGCDTSCTCTSLFWWRILIMMTFPEIL
jgi:hypothetical protein